MAHGHPDDRPNPALPHDCRPAPQRHREARCSPANVFRRCAHRWPVTKSASTALQVCRSLETDGWLARLRLATSVRRPRRLSMPALQEPNLPPCPIRRSSSASMPASRFRILRDRCAEQGPAGSHQSFRAACAASLYPGEALKNAATRALRRNPDLLVKNIPLNGNAGFRTIPGKAGDGKRACCYPRRHRRHARLHRSSNVALRAAAQSGDIIAVESPNLLRAAAGTESLGLRALKSPSPQTGIRWKR